MSSEIILCTVNEDIAAPFLKSDPAQSFPLLHLPLEKYGDHTDAEESGIIQKNLEDYAFIIHGNLRNTRFFIKWAEEQEVTDKLRQNVNIAADQPTADFLENRGIPAILPRKNARAIDVMEFLLRISREGNTLYPTTEDKSEEIPGLLEELEMPVHEFTVCKEVPLSPDTLEDYRKKVKSSEINAVLFHNRSSVIRIQKAFPELDLTMVRRIAANAGVAEKLKEEAGLEPDTTARGSWASIAEVL